MKKLTPRLPNDEVELAEKGFNGNQSRSKDWVTDGHVVFRFAQTRSRILNEAMRHYEANARFNSDKIEGLWELTEKTRKVDAAFIGCGRIGKGEYARFAAFLRDDKARVIAVNPHKFSFVLRCTNPDSFAISAASKPFERAIAFFKKGVMVALLMPLRYEAGDLEDVGYDWKAESVPLTEVYAVLQN